MEHFEKLLESISFRLGSVFSFKKMSVVSAIFKIILLLVLGVPFCCIEALGIIFALCSCLPFVGVILNFTFCLACDLLASGLFYLIMLPNLIVSKKASFSCQNKTITKEKSVGENQTIRISIETKDKLLPLLNIISNSFLGEDGKQIRGFIVLCMLQDDIPYNVVFVFMYHLKYLDDITPEFIKMPEMGEAINILADLLKSG